MKTLLFLITLAASVQAQTVQLSPSDWSANVAQGTAAAVGGPPGITGTLATSHALLLPRKLGVAWQFHDETRVWLSVNSYSGEDWLKDGFNPSFTYLRCHYKPEVRKLPDGQWIVTFISEITEKSPIP